MKHISMSDTTPPPSSFDDDAPRSRRGAAQESPTSAAQSLHFDARRRTPLSLPRQVKVIFERGSFSDDNLCNVTTCPHCGSAPSADHTKPHTFVYYPKWILVIIPIGWLFFAIAYLLLLGFVTIVLWPLMFFGLYPVMGTAALWLALLIIAAHAAFAVFAVLRFGPISTTAGVLMLPYVSWLVFSASLNLYAALHN